MKNDSCCPIPLIIGSENVFCNSLPVGRVGDLYAYHGCDDHPTHPDIIVSGSPNVFVNSKPIAIQGSLTNWGSVAVGCSLNVLVNDVSADKDSDSDGADFGK